MFQRKEISSFVLINICFVCLKRPLQQAAKSSFSVYICSLEQPWHFGLIATSNVPIIHLVWSLDGTHLLICNQTGVCRIFKMKVN